MDRWSLATTCCPVGPLAVGAPFLLLTWLLLLAEVDGTNLAWHEIFGLPLLCLSALGLTVYSWRKVVNPERIPSILILVIALSALFAQQYGNALPGDADHLFSEGITRGMIAGFAIPLFIFSIPPMVRLVWVRIGEFNLRRNPLQLRRVAMHVAHLGILLLLVGQCLRQRLFKEGILATSSCWRRTHRSNTTDIGIHSPNSMHTALMTSSGMKKWETVRYW
ncbi:MAG: hypothetical protein Ct9H90mP16_07030 [Candidatus Poseidoniales archaeon]|nr:MAG: hypothetical protein Ct9H90mP16_07030 [Candidatus Poseidoniales archaeon]